jgi:ABC-type transport system involved in cytochrome c biogenesis permease subunit
LSIFVKKFLAPLASLRLTIVLLAMAIILVYAGTWAQVDTGIWTVQKKYFHSLWVWISFQSLLPRPKPGQSGIPGGFLWPGGYMLGGMMLLNLLAAHITRFKFSLKRSGIILIHLGLILLIVGELLTSLLANEGQMVIDEGATANYSQDVRYGELVCIDPSASEKTDLVISFPQSQLQPGVTLHHDLVPFDVQVDQYLPNSQILGPMQTPRGVTAEATEGIGRGIAVVPKAEVAGTDATNPDMASAYVSIIYKGQNLGRYLLSYFFDAAQEVHAGDKTYLIALRFHRHYKPYSMQLIKFSHDKYLGTETPKNFASRVRLIDPANGVDREVVIRMNEPLRYAGETYYQASFREGDKTTILQVVRNPAWRLPYIACVLGALGLLIHFGIMLITSILKKSTRRANVALLAAQSGVRTLPVAVPFWWKIVPVGFAGLGVILTAGMYLHATSPSQANQFDLRGFGQLPLSFDGRLMPYDSLAKTSLQVILGRSTTKAGPDLSKSTQWANTPYDQWQSVSSIQWLLDTLTGDDRTNDYRIFRVDNPDLLGLLGLDADRSPRIYSFREIVAHQEKLQEQMSKVGAIEENKRDLFERKLAELYEHVQLYVRIAQLDNLYMVAPLSAAEAWQPIAPFLPTSVNDNPKQTQTSTLIISMLADYHSNDIPAFNAHVAEYRALLTSIIPAQVSKSDYEAFFNRFDPFLQAEILYVLIFVLGCVSWLSWGKPLGVSAFVLLVLALLLHTFGLASRIYISGHPPVTNLYSSAIFIAWAGVVLAIGLELYFRNVVAMVCASAMGFASLLIADHLAGDGDTMKQLQAVLDTNFWLATHVVTITLGYSATFLAGVLAISYIFIGVFTPLLTAPKPGRAEIDSPGKLLPRMVYAILCFAILFSFVGTVLGGIWADQSWGRFWGWDPKENGAVLIVLWNALTLHARWAGVVRQRGLMLLAVFGNVITSWSWFGTNMLGVGLHSYGFMDSALIWLLVFVISQIAIIALGSLPLSMWRSFAEPDESSDAPASPAAVA